MLPLHSQMKNGSLERVKRYNKFIEKTDFYTVQEASTEKYNLSRSVNSFEKDYKCQGQAKNYNKLYNEEFDPGSG